MARVTIEDCLQNIKNRYELVHLCVCRTRQIFRGSHAMVESDNGPVVTALREIAKGKVRFLQAVEDLEPPLKAIKASTENIQESKEKDSLS